MAFFVKFLNPPFHTDSHPYIRIGGPIAYIGGPTNCGCVGSLQADELRVYGGGLQADELWVWGLLQKIRENHAKIRIWSLGGLGGMEKIWPIAPRDYSSSFWTSHFSICLWERPKTLIFMISGFSNLSWPPKPIILSLETPGYIKQSKEKSQIMFNKSYLYKSLFEDKKPRNQEMDSPTPQHTDIRWFSYDFLMNFDNASCRRTQW